MIYFESFASSSAGNCYFLGNNNEGILVEAGIPLNEIEKNLNYDISKIKGCIITHEHKDHSQAALKLLQKGIDVYMTQGTQRALGIEQHYRLNIIESEKLFKIKEYKIMPFDTEHDAQEPVGFRIAHPETGKILFATDTYYIRYKIGGLSYVFIECNYDRETLQKNIDSGKVKQLRKRQITKNHFELRNLKSYIDSIINDNLCLIRLIHTSSENLRESAKEELQNTFDFVDIDFIETNKKICLSP